MGWPPTASQLPNGRPAARHIEGKEEVGNAKKMVVRARLKQERAPELARDDLACGLREEVGLQGHLGPKSLPGRSWWWECTWRVC